MLAASLALVVGCIALASVAQAQWVVTNTNDSGAGSLRQAILNADAAAPTGAPGATQTITFSGAGVGTITLTSGALPLIYTNVNIQGVSGVAIDGNNLYRGLFVSGLANTGNGAPPAISVGISNVTIENVVAQGGAGGAGGGGGGLGAGGGLFINQNANVTITNVSFGNASAAGGNGGAAACASPGATPAGNGGGCGAGTGGGGGLHGTGGSGVFGGGGGRPVFFWR
jgi:hypothetical protein